MSKSLKKVNYQNTLLLYLKLYAPRTTNSIAKPLIISIVEFLFFILFIGIKMVNLFLTYRVLCLKL